jgi:HAE1 family hydrophobic/amphiphilic exporter-1
VTVLLRILGFASLLIVVATLVKASPLMPLVVLMYIAVAFVFMRVRTPLAEAFDRTIKKAGSYPVRPVRKSVLKPWHRKIEPLANAYYRLIMRILNSDSARRKVIFAIITYSVVAFLLVPLGLVKNEFFPKSDSELVYVNLNLPSGTTAREPARETSAILEKLRHIRDTNFVVAETSQQMSSGMGSRSDNTASSVFTVHLPKQEERSRQSMDIATEIRSMFKGYTKGDISVIEQSSGPPAGSDLQIKLSGTDLNKLDSYAEQLMGYLRKQSGIAMWTSP